MRLHLIHRTEAERCIPFPPQYSRIDIMVGAQTVVRRQR